MSYSISGIEVIDGSRVLKNITGGYYQNHQAYPNVTTITSPNTIVDMKKPVHFCSMSFSFTFTLSNVDTGLSAMLIIDRSATGYTPVIGGVIWPGSGAAPTWSDHRYWNIGLTCFDSSTVFATAAGYDA